jgi:hypothetical protein
MKRSNLRKLSLSTNTVRPLVASELRGAAGGISGARCNLSKHCGSGSIGSASGAPNCAWSFGAC